MHCGRLLGSLSGKNEATSGYLIQHDSVSLLLDCGSGVLSKLQNYIRLESLDAVLITHTHADHMCDLHSLEFSIMILMRLGRRKNPLDVYLYSPESDLPSLSFPENVKLHPLDVFEPLSIGDLALTFCENVHEVPCCAIKIQDPEGNTLVYSGDTGYHHALVEFSRHADVLIIECSFYNFQNGRASGHLTAGQAGEIASRAHVKQVILTHLPHYGDHRQLLSEAGECFTGKLQLASDGLTISL